jgi:hypothetical protein
LLFETLEDEGIHPWIRAEYEIDGVERRRRVIRDIFWITLEQIRLARRFVSGFMYETDSTFNTNRLRLPLSVIVGIDNTGKRRPHLRPNTGLRARMRLRKASIRKARAN